jgi:hypothetical protein
LNRRRAIVYAVAPDTGMARELRSESKARSPLL